MLQDAITRCSLDVYIAMHRSLVAHLSFKSVHIYLWSLHISDNNDFLDFCSTIFTSQVFRLIMH